MKPASKPYRAIAEYYDGENAQQRVLEEDIPFFLGQLPRKKQSILELAAGTARAAIPLAQAGHRVIGLDYAPEMLDIARRKRDTVGLTEKQLSLVQADATNFDLSQQFDWVCVFFNTFLAFTTLEQQDAVMHGVMRHLKPKGRFWVDVFYPDLRLLAEPLQLDLDPTLFYVPRFDRTVLKTIESRRSRIPQVQNVTFHYSWFSPDGQDHHEQTKFDMTYLFPRELHMLVERHGLQVEHMWGNYDASAVGPDSPRIIARCCRR